MAQKKLLFPLMLILACSLNAGASESFELKKEEEAWVTKLSGQSRNFAMEAIKEKWLELQQMQKTKANEIVMDSVFAASSNDLSNVVLRIFVSSSMSQQLLKNYAKQAKKYNAILVFNGLPQNSWRKLSDLVYSINGDAGVTMQLDDLAFNEYGIQSVPSFVLVKEEGVFDEIDSSVDRSTKASEFDKIVGNIGIKRALQEFASAGDLSEAARALLAQAGDRN